MATGNITTPSHNMTRIHVLAVSGKKYMPNKLSTAIPSLILLLPLILSACGGSDNPPPRQERPAALAAGVSDARNANIVASEFENSEQIITSTQSNSSGQFELSITHASGPILVSSTGGNLRSLGGSDQNLNSDGFKSLFYYESGEDVSVNLNVFTTAAACLAEVKIAEGLAVEEALDSTLDLFEQWFGFSIERVTPVDLSLVESFTTNPTHGHLYGVALEGVKEAIEKLRIADNAPLSQQYTVGHFSSLVCDDIKNDGLLDGVGSSTVSNPTGQVSVGNFTITPDFYRTSIAQAMLSSVKNELNETGLVMAQVLDFSNQYSLYDNTLFASYASQSVDREPPIVQTQAAENKILTDVAEIEFELVEDFGIQETQVDVMIDSVFYATLQVDNPVLTVNTALFEPGDHVISFVVHDLIGNEGVFEQVFQFLEVHPFGETIGKVQHGPISNATITGRTWPEGEFLEQTTSDNEGRYTLELQHQDVNVSISTSGGTYSEEATLHSVNMGSSSLRALLHYTSGNSIRAQATIFTNDAACYAEYLLETEQYDPVNSITRANEALTAIAGVAIMLEEPVDLTDDAAFSTYLTDEIKYALLLAGASHALETLRIEHGAPSSAQGYLSKTLASLRCDDIKDGLLDGVANGNMIRIGNTPIDPYFYRTLIARGMFDFLNGEHNKSGLTVDDRDVIAFVNSYSLNTSDLYAGHVPVSADLDGPSITIGLAEFSLLSGTVDLEFIIQDPLGLSGEIHYYVDHALVSTTSNEIHIFNLSTNAYADGDHVVSVTAFDTLGNEGTKDFRFTFINDGPRVAIESATLFNQRSYTASGSYVQNDGEVDRIEVNGVDATLNTTDQTWHAEIELEGGVNTVSADIFDVLGNTTNAEIEVSIDLFPPTLRSTNTSVTFTSFNGALGLCYDGFLHGESSADVPLCLNTEAVLLGDREIAPSLFNYGYILIGFDVVDPVGNGVFSEIENIGLEYQVLLNGDVTVDWAAVPRPGNNSGQIYLPVTEEFFGVGFYQVTYDDKFEVKIRAIDESGSLSRISFNFSLDVLSPVLLMTTELKSEGLFSTSYSTRHGLNSATYAIEYTYENESSIPYLISINPGRDHFFEQEWQGAIRKNKVREFARGNWEQWQIIPEDFTILGTVMKMGEYLQENAGTRDILYRYDEGILTPVATETKYKLEVDLSSNSYTPSGSIEAHDPNIECLASAYQYTTVSDPVIGQPVTRYHSRNYFTGQSTDNSAWCFYNSTISYDGEAEFYYYVPRIRYTYDEYEFVEGYPRNEFTTHSTNYTVANSEFRVIDKSKGLEIFPIGGWYSIPPNTDVSLVREITLPAINNKVDLRVGSNSSAVPYSGEIFQDTSISWSLDTDIEITRVVDSGDLSELGSMSHTVSTAGLGVKSYTIVR